MIDRITAKNDIKPKTAKQVTETEICISKYIIALRKKVPREVFYKLMQIVGSVTLAQKSIKAQKIHCLWITRQK